MRLTIVEMRTTRWCVEANVTPLETNSRLHGKKTCNEAPGHANHQSNCTQIFFPCSEFEPSHFHQNFPNCLRSSSISVICGVPINTILLPFCHFCYPHSFPLACQRRRQRNRHACRPCSAPPHHTANDLPILSSLVHSGPTAWHPLLLSSRSVLPLSMLWAS